ncbi:MAG: nuclear transport factor 2 family protein [Pseudomonadota bacterium]
MRLIFALALLLPVQLVLGAQDPGTAAGAARVAQLRAEVTAAEDFAAIKRLQRTYGYYVDKGMWTDLAEYFTDDAVANYPAGVFVGKPSIREHLYRNVGIVQIGEVGLGNNRLYNHMNIQPVVHIDPAGNTARGRWRALAMFGSLNGGATWAEGLYEMQYRKESGVWKISKLDYHAGFGAPYATGWGAPTRAPAAVTDSAAAAPANRARRQLAHPADRERDSSCEGFPAACLPPFDYANPATKEGGTIWTAVAVPAAGAESSTADARTEVADLLRRAERLKDQQEIENLQRIYGFYYDRASWDQMVDLFSSKGTIEFAQQGVYVGRKRVRQFLGTLGHDGLTPGWLNDHMQLQIVVDVSPDGRTAWSRSRELAMTGHAGVSGEWSEGIYENRFVKEDGKWQFASVHFYPTFQSDYDAGWGKSARPAQGVNATLPPDRPPTEVYEIYPKPHVPPYHYRNPVTGKPPTYPGVDRGGPTPQLAAADLQPTEAAPAARLPGDVGAALSRAENDVARFKDYHSIENLQSAYGYYLDKSLWDPLADLFARNGSIELAQRGVYKGADSVRNMLWMVFGRGGAGPVAGRLGNHLQLQPVITVAPDGQSAKIRVRMLQQMAMGGRASIGASIYENEAVKEDGVWKFSVDHTMNTLSAAYAGGWAKGASRFMPGPSAQLPADAPPSMKVVMFPVVYDIPFHYANPVSGRTQLPKIPSIDEQMAQLPMKAE